MNIAEAFSLWMNENNYGTLGVDLFIGGIPQDAPDKSYWIIGAGGSPITKNTTGEKQKNYIIHIFYRNTDQEDVYNKLQSLEELLNAKECVQIGDYTTLQIEASTFPIDQDIDSNDRSIGLLQATITIYQSD